MRGDVYVFLNLIKYNTLFCTNGFIEKPQARTPERCLVRFKICHSKWCHKICNQTFSYRFIVAAMLEEKSYIFWCLSISIYLLIKARESSRSLKCSLHVKFKIDVRQEDGVLFFECVIQPECHSWLHVCICA